MIRIVKSIGYREAGSDGEWVSLPIVAAAAKYTSTEKSDNVGTLLEEKVQAVLSRQVLVPSRIELLISFEHDEDVFIMGCGEWPARATVRTGERVEFEANCASVTL